MESILYNLNYEQAREVITHHFVANDTPFYLASKKNGIEEMHVILSKRDGLEIERMGFGNAIVRFLENGIVLDYHKTTSVLGLRDFSDAKFAVVTFLTTEESEGHIDLSRELYTLGDVIRVGSPTSKERFVPDGTQVDRNRTAFENKQIHFYNGIFFSGHGIKINVDFNTLLKTKFRKIETKPILKISIINKPEPKPLELVII